MSIGSRSRQESVVRTTIGLPWELLDFAQAEVQAGSAASRNEAILEARRREQRRREREAIDEDIRGMTRDPAYLAEQRQIMAEFGART
jgi:Arc/MetJ-type ribon-helix-helix transcriptional regulator